MPKIFEAAPRVFYISLYNQQSAYFAGQTIQGEVVLELKEPKSTRGVFVQLIGTASTHFHPDVQDNPIETCRATAQFIGVKLQVWTPQSGKEELPAGTHRLPFAFVLPAEQSWPPTFNGWHGSISYVLRANVDRPMKWDHKCFLPVVVLPLVDSNNPRFLSPVRNENERGFCCCCCCGCGSGHVIAEAEIPRGAYCAGETISVAVRIHNESGKKLRGINVSLMQSVQVHARNQYRTDLKAMQSSNITGKPIAPGDTADHVVTLRVPVCCPCMSRETSKLIELTYFVQVQVRTPGCKNLVTRVPVVIATVPRMEPSAPPQYQQWATPMGVLEAAARAVVPPAQVHEYNDDMYAKSEPDPAMWATQVNYPCFQIFEPSAPPMAAAGTQQPMQMQYVAPTMETVQQPGALPPPQYTLPAVSAPAPPGLVFCPPDTHHR